MLHKLFNPESQITSKSFLLSSFLIGFFLSPTTEISRLELEFEESLPRKTASIFKEGIGQGSNGAANQEKQIFLLCQISPSASSTRDLGRRLVYLRYGMCRLQARVQLKTLSSLLRNRQYGNEAKKPLKIPSFKVTLVHLSVTFLCR